MNVQRYYKDNSSSNSGDVEIPLHQAVQWEGSRTGAEEFTGPGEN